MTLMTTARLVLAGSTPPSDSHVWRINTYKRRARRGHHAEAAFALVGHVLRIRGPGPAKPVASPPRCFISERMDAKGA
jgi:hypothetical protein